MLPYCLSIGVVGTFHLHFALMDYGCGPAEMTTRRTDDGMAYFRKLRIDPGLY